MQIVAVDKVRLFPEHIKKLKYYGSLTIYNDIPSKKEGILRLQNADIAIVHWYKMPKAVLKSVPKLKAVMLASTGTDRIDLLAAKKTGITVCNVPKYCVEATAQFTIGALLNASRFIIKSVEDVKHGEYFSYNYKGIKGIELQGKTLGIVGFGLIGRKVAEIAKKGFGLE